MEASCLALPVNKVNLALLWLLRMIAEMLGMGDKLERDKVVRKGSFEGVATRPLIA